MTRTWEQCEAPKGGDLSGWLTPPINQGQIEVSFAADWASGIIYRRTSNRATGQVEYTRRNAQNVIAYEGIERRT